MLSLRQYRRTNPTPSSRWKNLDKINKNVASFVVGTEKIPFSQGNGYDIMVQTSGRKK